MKKTMYLALAVLFLWGVWFSTPLKALAAEGEPTITAVELTATKTLIEKYSGYYDPEGTAFLYNIDATEPQIVLTYSDNNTKTIPWSGSWEFFNAISFGIDQNASNQLTVGSYTTDITLYDLNNKEYTSTMSFTIEENPVESISVVANNSLTENLSGDFTNVYDEEGNIVGRDFDYNLSYADIKVTVNYKNGTSSTYDYCGEEATDIMQQTGYELLFENHSNLVVGSNTVTAIYMGVETPFEVVVVENPYKSISLEATDDLIYNFSGENYDDYFEYSFALTQPIVTVTYANNDVRTYTYSECGSQFGDYPEFKIEQSATNQFVKGENTQTVSFLGHECEFTFNIVETPVESIIVNTPPMQANDYGYSLDSDETKVTINYKDESKPAETYILAQLEEEYYDEFSLSLNQGENELTVGKHQGTVSFLGYETTFEFEIIENLIKSVTAVGTEKLIENEDGSQNGEYDGEPYFHYYIYDTNPKVTVTFSDGTVKTYNYYDLEELGYDYDLDVFQNAENPLKVGKNTGYIELNGVRGEFTFEIVETPVESIIVNTPPMQASDYGYSLNAEETKVTINYKDESKPAETYTLAQLNDEYCDEFSLSLNQGENELTVGKHEGIVSFLGFTTTFEFEIIANPIKSVTAVGTEKLIENEDGSMNSETVGEDYFSYDVDRTYPKVTVTFYDGTVKTYDYYDLGELGYDYDLYVFQNAENPLKVGKNTGYIELNGVKGEFTFEIVENPIKSISLKATKALVEKQNGCWSVYRGTEVFCYYVEETLPEVTVNYTDGTSETYSYSEYFRVFDYYMDLDQRDQFASPFKVGENTIKAYIGNFECDYTFNIVKPEVAITGITVVPESTLLEAHSGNWEWDSECEKEYFCYAPGAVNYTLIVKYEDGTQETYENVFYNQTVDGGYFSAYFGDWTYENRYVVGKNKAYAEYKGARTTFDIEVVKNDIKNIEISGENEFVLTTIATDGTKTKYTAKDFIIGAGEENIYYGSLYTDKGALMISLSLNLNDDETQFEDIITYFTLPDGTVLESNKLSSNRWLDMIFCAMNLDEASKWLYDGYSEKYFGNSFHELEGSVIKGSAVDKALTICTALAYIGNYENTGEDDKGRFAILTLEEAKKLANNYFADGKLDIESSPLYNAPAKEIKVYFLLGCDGIGINRELKYENGKFILTSICENHDTNEAIPVKMVLADTGYVEAVYVSEHVYTSEIIKQPTATEKGIKEYTCSCGDSYLADIDKLVASVPVNKDNSFSATVTVTETENIVSKIEITKEEQELIDLGLDLKIILEVKEIENKIDTEEKKAIFEILGEQKLGAFIDIQLVKQIGDYQKNIETTNGKIYVSLELPKTLINNDLNVERVYKVARYHYGDENAVTILDATYDVKTNQLTFGTDRFSTYAIIYNDIEVSNDGASGGVSEGVPVIPDSDNVTNDNSKDDVPKAGVISTSAIWFGAMAVSGLGALALSKKKRED